ncbi:MAG: competence/damage-inducible protein A, partial [Clostridiales Family XIII bacterium]|nr:competence/damage-inducible protein A [Clostridiales Family XIII bacterium]
MPSASIVAVGTELLFGQVVNTNAAYISEQLQLLGISVLYHFTVGDNPARVKQTIGRAAGESDIVITTGGLGPTQDDLTKELIAELAGRRLVHDEEALRRLDAIMRDIGRGNYTENNLKQALLPEGAAVFYNEAGTAPGFALEAGGNTFIALPGPPREMIKMMHASVIPYLAKKSNAVIFSKLLRFYGIGESALETALLPIIDGQTDPTVATYAKEGECAVRVSSMRQTAAEAEAAVEAAVSRARALAGQYLYNEENKDYPQVIVELLGERHLKLAAAESCTGGLFAGAITAVPGASEVFDRGFVTYSNEAKMEMIGVSTETLDKYGAVSEPCAREMALGALAHSCADVAVAVTGIAGPGGGAVGKPVGTVFFAVAGRAEVFGGAGGADAAAAGGAAFTVLTGERYFRDRGRRVN